MRFILCALFLASPAVAKGCSEGQRPFEHAAGIDCIPVDPQRIVALQYQNALLPLVELGVMPVGASGPGDGGTSFPEVEGYDVSTVVHVGPHRSEDIERVAALDPDLIIATPSPDWHYQTFGLIAPIIVIDMFNQPVQAALHQFADAVNRTEVANTMEAQLNKRVAELRAKLGDIPAETTAMVISNIGGTPRIMPWVQGFGAAFEAIGFQRTEWEHKNASGTASIVLSREALGEIEADAIFVIDFSGDDSSKGEYEEIAADPFFKLTPAGRAGQIFQIDGTRMGGTSWLRTIDGIEQLAAILGSAGFDTDVVME